jgi:hypothetical protein
MDSKKAGESMKKSALKKGDTIFWRWKLKWNTKTSYLESIIKDINGDLITFDSHYTYSQNWIDINEIDYKEKEN